MQFATPSIDSMAQRSEAAHRTICDVLPSVAAALGLAEGRDRLGLREQLAEATQILVLLVDGMGAQLLPRMAPHAPLLTAIRDGEVGRLQRLESTFPSTTPTSLVSFGTGVRAGEHGVLGFAVNVPGTQRVLGHVGWRDDPAPDTWQPVPTWFERIAAAGVDVAAVLPAAFGGSGLTEAAFRGARFQGVGRTDDYAAALLAELHRGTRLVYGYASALDAAAHAYGIASEQWASAAASVDLLVRRLQDGLPTNSALLVTADHGGLDIPMDARYDLDTTPGLADGVELVAGEPRVRYLHVADGAARDVIQTWRAVLGDEAIVLGREEAIADGWFGPVPAEHRVRIGDVVVICTKASAVVASRQEPAEALKLVAFHGGPTPPEVEIPLMTIPAGPRGA
jgi:hypothetical protein